MSQYPGAQPPGGPYYGSGRRAIPTRSPSHRSIRTSVRQRAIPMPSRPSTRRGRPSSRLSGYQQPYQQPAYPQQPVPPPAEPSRARSGGGGAAIAGIFLVVLGAWFLFRDQVSFDLGQAWPLIAVVLGVLMIIGAFIPRRRG